MATPTRALNQDVAYLAGQILMDLRERKAGLGTKLAHTRELLPHLHPSDTLEQERLEVLEGAVESLESPVTERAQAAMHLLQQLALTGTAN
jgi:hypothetical protein